MTALRRAALVGPKLAILALIAFASSCASESPTTPSGSTLTLTTPNRTVSVSGTATLTAELRNSGGQPMPGATIAFSTTLGTIEPAQSVTSSAGLAIVRFSAGTASGTAVITARAGGVEASPLSMVVGAVSVGRVAVTASPDALPFGGGTTTVTAVVTDAASNPLSFTPVGFTTTSGSVTPANAKTDANGSVTTTLTTTTAAVVTAVAGVSPVDIGAPQVAAFTNSVTVPMTGRPVPAVSIAASGNAVAGTPVTFMIAATPPSGTNTTIRSVAVSFGDGETNNLGAVSGTDIAVQHVYAAGGTYTVSATATDSGGGTAAASTVVAVRAAAPLSVSIAAGPMVPPGGGPKAIVTFAAAVFPATSVVTSYVWDFGDGSGTQQTTGNQLQHVFANPAVYTVTVTVTEALTGRTATNSVPVSTASGIPAVSIAASESPVAGRATTFKMSAVVAPGTSVSMQSVKVAFGDGASVDLGAVTGDAITASHVYASAGTYVASVTATDSGGGTATASTQVVVAAPGAPSVTASLVGAAVAGTPATFAVGATPAAGSPTTIQSVKVTFGDGTPSVDLGAITAPTTTQHVYAASGSYTVSVVATDSGGTTATASVQVVVGAAAPTVSVTAGANPVVGTPTTFTITAVAAAGSNTTIQNVRVAFGDGTPPVDLGAINAPTTTQHVYAAAGNYTVSATATVSNGATATASTQVAVAAPAPTVSVTAGANPVAGTATTFTITAAPAAGSNTTIQNVRVTFGDGSSADLGAVNSTTTQHVYAAAGNYTASATATVSNGATATASTQVVVVAPAPPGAPSLSIAPTGRPVANTPTTFTITTAPPPGTNATITNVRVNFGDNTPLVDLGALGASATTQHVYASPGTRTVSATATASNGGTATASTQVVIAAPPSPSISITAGANPVTGRAVTFSITTTPAPGSGTTIQNVRVNFGDNTPVADLGAVAGSATTQHVYAAAGTFTVTATAADTGGGTATATTSVIVVASATLSLSASAGPVASVAMQFTVGVAPGPGVTIQNVRLAYGDGTQDDLGVVSGTPRVQSHTYAASGVVTATLTVTIAGGTTPLTTSISVTVACGPLTNRTLTFTSLVIGMLQNWPGTLQTVSTGPSCLANIRAPTGAINAPSGNTWTLSSTVGYQGANCTLTSQVPTCAGGGGALQPNGRPFCPNADPALRSTAAVVVNCR